MLAEWIKNHRGKLINAYIVQISEVQTSSETQTAEASASALVETLTRFVAAPLITLLVRVLQGQSDWASGVQKIAQNASHAHGLSTLESLRGVQTMHRVIRTCLQETAAKNPPAEAPDALSTQQIAWLSQLADLEAQAAYVIIQAQEKNLCELERCCELERYCELERCCELERYHELYDSMPEGLALHEIIYAESTDPDETSTPIDYVVLDVNAAYEDMWGMRQVPVFIGQKASEVYNGDTIPYLEVYAEVAMSGNPTAFEITDRLLGTTFYVSVFSPTKGQFATLVKDITQRKRVEEKQQKLIAVLENSDDFIGLVTFEGQSFYVNAAGRTMLGLEGNGRFVHTAFFEYFKPEDMPYIRQQVLPTVVEQGAWEGPLNFRDVERGRDIPTYCNIFVVKDMNNQNKPPLGLGIVGRSIERHQRMAGSYEVGAGGGAASEVPLIPVVPLSDDLEAVTAKMSEQTARLPQALLAKAHTHTAACASKIVFLDIAGLEKTLKTLAVLDAQTPLSQAMAEALEKLGIDLDPPKTQSQG